MNKMKKRLWKYGLVPLTAFAVCMPGFSALLSVPAAAEEWAPVLEREAPDDALDTAVFEAYDLESGFPSGQESEYQQPEEDADPSWISVDDPAAAEAPWTEETAQPEEHSEHSVSVAVEDTEEPEDAETGDSSIAVDGMDAYSDVSEAAHPVGYVTLRLSCPETGDAEGAVFGIYYCDDLGQAGRWTGFGFYTDAKGTGWLTGQEYRQTEDPREFVDIYNEKEDCRYSVEKCFFCEKDQFYYYPSHTREVPLEPGVYVLKLVQALDPELHPEMQTEFLFSVAEDHITELDDSVSDLLRGDALVKDPADDSEEGPADGSGSDSAAEPEDGSKDSSETDSEDSSEDDAEADSEDGPVDGSGNDSASDPDMGMWLADLSGLDFSSRRLILGISDPELIVDPEVIVSCYGSIYLLQYETEEQAREAYAYYAAQADFIEVDTGISIAEGEAAETVLTDTVMTVSENPLSELEKAVSHAGTGSLDIALIDTGADGAEECVSMLGDDGNDSNGHGSAMLAYIRQQAPEASVLSIKALGADGKGDVSAVYAALQYAIARQVKIINLSVSALASADSGIIEMAINEAVQQGILVVGAAGNNGRDARYYIPGGISSALIVGACDFKGRRLPDSNFGASVDYLIAADSTSEAAARCSGWLAVHGAAAIEDARNQGFIFDVQNPDADSSEVPEGDDKFRIAELLYSGGTRISRTLKEDPSLVSCLEPITPRNGNIESISFSDNWNSSYWYVRDTMIDCKFLWLEPGYQTFQDTWYLMRGESGYDVRVTILNATNESRGRSVISVNTSNGGMGLDFGMLSAAQKLVDGSAQWIYTRENWLNGTYYEITVAVDIYRHGTTERINAPTLYAAITDVDYGQRYKINNDPISVSSAVIEDAAAFDQDKNNTGLYSCITSTGDIYSEFDRTMGMNGVPDNTNNKATVYAPVTKPKNESLIMTFGYIRDAGSSILFYADSVRVYYRAEQGGTITGAAEELLARNDTASGTTQKPDSGYQFTGYTSDVDLQLTDGTQVTANSTVLTEEQVKQAVITADTTFTAHYISALRIRKVDAETGQGLSGAKFSIYDKTGKTVQDQWTTDPEVHIVKGLSTGETYLLKEESVPEKYLEDEGLKEGVLFSISSDGSVQLEQPCEAIAVKDGILTISNTKLEQYSLTVKKSVSGGMANRYQDFDFTLKLSNSHLDPAKCRMTWVKSDGTEGTVELDDQKQFAFALRHGQDIVIRGIPEGSDYQVEEDTPAGYTVTSEQEQGTMDADKTASFVNHNEAAIPTGLHVGVFAGPIAIAASLALLLTYRIRKRNEK